MAWIQKPRTRVGVSLMFGSAFFSFCVSSDAFCLGLRGFVQTTCWDCDRSQYFPAFLWRQPSCGSRLRREEQRVIGCAAASGPPPSISHGLLHNCAHLRALEGCAWRCSSWDADSVSMFFSLFPSSISPRLEAIVRCGYWECKQHVLLTVDAAAAPRILLTGLLDQSPHNAFTAWAVPLAVVWAFFFLPADRTYTWLRQH
ncbi:hypothetical protein V8C40DRAFT_142842 [Trichoderma camerunense]